MKKYWLEGHRIIEYKKEDHFSRVTKFLYWSSDSEEILLAGFLHSHTDLLRVAVNVELDEPDMIIGAGDAEGGFVRGWSSGGFEVSTPENIRAKIAEALGLVTR